MTTIKFSTPDAPGLHELISENNSALNVMRLYALNLQTAAHYDFETKDSEACLIPVQGEVECQVAGRIYPLQTGDCLYLPRRRLLTVRGLAPASRVAICTAKTDADTDIIHTRFADAWQSADGHETHGKYSYTRDVINLLARSDKAGRLVAGITVGQDGGWTSWPPHHHSETLEEIYYYYGLPATGFGVHIDIFMDGSEQAEIVRSGDAVIVPDGYHPTVASPGARMQYIWFLGAKRTEEDRRGKVTNHPHYA